MSPGPAVSEELKIKGDEESVLGVIEVLEQDPVLFAATGEALGRSGDNKLSLIGDIEEPIRKTTNVSAMNSIKK